MIRQAEAELATSAPPQQTEMFQPVTDRGAERVRLVDRVPVALLGADVLALAIAAVLADLAVLPAVVHVAVTTALLVGRSVHRPRLTLSLTDDAPALLGALTLGLATATFATVALGDMEPWRDVIAMGGFSIAVVFGMRALAHLFIRQARRRGWATHQTLVVGTDPVAHRLATLMQQHPELGLRFAGFVGPAGPASPEVVDSLVGQESTQLARLCRRLGASVVVVSPTGADAEALLGIRRWGPRFGPTVYVAPELYPLMHSVARDRIRDIALIRIRPTTGVTLAWRVKALLDRVVAAILLVIAAPVMVLVAAAVRYEGGKGVLFRQTRVGRGGRPFTLYKFRSMRPAEKGDSARRWSIADASGLGPVGRFIRKTSLDELPQLFNIVNGDMSLVGPRPERPHFVEQFAEDYDGYSLRHRVRPGLTGWAAVSGLRGDTSIEERAHFDNVYIDNWSLGFDLKVLALTALAVIRGTGE